MKKIMTVTFISTIVLSTVFARTPQQPPPEFNKAVGRVVQMTDLTPEITKELFKGTHPDLAIKFEAGTEFSLKYLGNYKLFSLSFSPNLSLKVEKTFYLRIIKKKTYLSYDLEQWDLGKRFIGGMLNTAVGFNEDRSQVLIQTEPEKEYTF